MMNQVFNAPPTAGMLCGDIRIKTIPTGIQNANPFHSVEENSMKNNRLVTRALILALIILWLSGSLPAKGSGLAATPLGTTFTYQGQLKDGSGNPITNTCDFQFNLYDAATSGNLVGNNPQTVTGVAVSNGYFTVNLDFGTSAFDGNKRWLQIAVSCPAGGSYTPLTPLQPLTAAPYAFYATKAGTAAQLSGVLPVANGGTGSGTQNFVDLGTTQTVGGVKTFSNAPAFNAAGAPFSVTSSSLVTNLNADLLDGQHASAFQQQHPQNMRMVAKSGGDFTSITAALNSITDASATNPYLIYVAPGVYAEQVTMKPYVDIEGAGEAKTKITGGGSSTETTGTLLGADNAELRSLTVENAGSASLTYATAIFNTASLSLDHVTAVATGAHTTTGIENYTNLPSYSPVVTMTDVTASVYVDGPGVASGIYNKTVASGPGGNKMTINMSDVTAGASASATTFGIYNQIQSGAMTVTMSNVTVTASAGANGNSIYGVYNIACSPNMTNVIVNVSGRTNSTDYGVYNNSSSSPIMQNISATVSGVGSDSNIGINNNSSSPSMTNVTTTVSQASTNFGVSNNSSSPVMMGVTNTLSGGTNNTNYGVYNISSSPAMTNVSTVILGGTGSTNFGVYNNSSSPVMMGITNTVSGGTNNYGVYNSSSTPAMTNISATVSGGTSNYGFYNSSSSPAMMSLSAIASGGSSDYGLYNTASSPTLASANLNASGGTINYGVWNDSSSMIIKDSVISATGNGGTTYDGIHNFATSGTFTITVDASQITGNSSTVYQTAQYTTHIGATRLVGGGGQGSGTYLCIFSYNANYVALGASTCQ